MKILRVISLLLDYPTQELVAAQTELREAVAASSLAAADKAALQQFIQMRCAGDLFDWQEQYDGLFERGRSLSLLLFEHVHGESRDRGQAMVDLQNQYKEAGLEISTKELPDYIPLYLDFLSTQGNDNARLGLQEVSHILALLACRLEQRESDYASLFHALVGLSEVALDLNDLRGQIAGEVPDNTPKALDKVWEEEMVSFMDNAESSCGTGNRPSEGQRRDQYIPLNTELLNASAAKQA
ncbi:MAG: nitrate reductase molybdenum cofactor assembly chaperone [Saccharospirillaceae bacterium]|nr:nitrate reductase molybdenum cofactor assembly chaperone [Saccharospirillaceae bacterium]MCD8532171.1 nitrate reductase molybdenum cofactor assembly chaperone [Saccharospirillaceae bacterium]